MFDLKLNKYEYILKLWVAAAKNNFIGWKLNQSLQHLCGSQAMYLI